MSFGLIKLTRIKVVGLQKCLDLEQLSGLYATTHVYISSSVAPNTQSVSVSFRLEVTVF